MTLLKTKDLLWPCDGCDHLVESEARMACKLLIDKPHLCPELKKWAETFAEVFENDTATSD